MNTLSSIKYLSPHVCTIHTIKKTAYMTSLQVEGRFDPQLWNHWDRDLDLTNNAAEVLYCTVLYCT